MKKRDFLKSTAAITMGAFLPSPMWAMSNNKRLRTAHIGLGIQGVADLKATAAHKAVEVVALCDVDSKMLADAQKMYPEATIYADYRIMLKEMAKDIDAV